MTNKLTNAILINGLALATQNIFSVGTGGDYANVAAAISDSKYKLRIISNVTEPSATITLPDAEVHITIDNRVAYDLSTARFLRTVSGRTQILVEGASQNSKDGTTGSKLVTGVQAATLFSNTGSNVDESVIQVKNLILDRSGSGTSGQFCDFGTQIYENIVYLMPTVASSANIKSASGTTHKLLVVRNSKFIGRTGASPLPSKCIDLTASTDGIAKLESVTFDAGFNSTTNQPTVDFGTIQCSVDNLYLNTTTQATRWNLGAAIVNNLRQNSSENLNHTLNMGSNCVLQNCYQITACTIDSTGSNLQVINTRVNSAFSSTITDVKMLNCRVQTLLSQGAGGTRWQITNCHFVNGISLAGSLNIVTNVICGFGGGGSATLTFASGSTNNIGLGIMVDVIPVDLGTGNVLLSGTVPYAIF